MTLPRWSNIEKSAKRPNEIHNKPKTIDFDQESDDFDFEMKMKSNDAGGKRRLVKKSEMKGVKDSEEEAEEDEWSFETPKKRTGKIWEYTSDSFVCLQCSSKFLTFQTKFKPSVSTKKKKSSVRTIYGHESEDNAKVSRRKGKLQVRGLRDYDDEEDEDEMADFIVPDEEELSEHDEWDSQLNKLDANYEEDESQTFDSGQSSSLRMLFVIVSLICLAISDVLTSLGSYTIKQSFEIYLQYFISFLLDPDEFNDIPRRKNKSMAPSVFSS